MPFAVRERFPSGMVLLEPKAFEDERGFFMETYRRSDFLALGIEAEFAQDNHSRSAKGTLRGLHYQAGDKAQGKLVRVTRGSIWDVGVDVDPRSPTYRSWYGVELSERNRLILYLPPRCAHGFIALEDGTELLYKCSAEYDAASERGIRWDDPSLAIAWPLKPALVSAKDAGLPFLGGPA